MHRSEQQTSVVSGLRAFSAGVERSRGTGPRTTVTTKKSSLFTVGRGPVPRQRPRNPTIAGDRPPRYGNIETRRAILRYCIETGRFLLPVNGNFAPTCFPVFQFLNRDIWNVNTDEVVKGDETKGDEAREKGSLASRNANCFIPQAILHDTQRLQACRPCAGR